ncbi:RNA polymerase sigma factor [Algibacter sp. Ld11]|uniref:RNA polymerase sigma factor n=1 Tax=Algibacter sp. Ld11 TaxID=649150 RepID=UPI00386BEB14
MTEKDAVKAFKEGDKKAFSYLFNLYYDRLVAYVIIYTHNKMSAEDIVQQTFVDLWKDREKLLEVKSPKNYLYAIAHNRYVDSMKKQKKQTKLLDSIYEKALRDRIEEDKEALDNRIKRMNEIIESLPPKCKEILKMNKIQGIKYKEIAVKMGISIKTVEAQMRIAFQKIREGFESDKLFFVFINKLLHPFRG